MKAWVAVLLTAWFCFNISIFGSANDDNFTTVGADPISFITKDATTAQYSTFLQSIRNAAKSNQVSNGIPVLPETIAENKRYFVAKLINKVPDDKGKEKDVVVTLGLEVINLYVLAYQVGDNSYFFSDAPSTAMTYLFKGTKQNKLKFGGRYDDLKNQGADRTKTQLGLVHLTRSITKLNGNNPTDKDKAGALLVIIQMVSEATRFKYIEEEFKSNFNEEYYKPRADVTSRENNWRKLSSGILLADSNGNFVQPKEVKLYDINEYDLEVEVTITKVSQVQSQMGILLFVKKGKGYNDELTTIGKLIQNLNDLLQPLRFDAYY